MRKKVVIRPQKFQNVDLKIDQMSITVLCFYDHKLYNVYVKLK